MLERRATGEGNWVFTPSADLIRSDVLSRVRLDQISLTGGTVSASATGAAAKRCGSTTSMPRSPRPASPVPGGCARSRSTMTARWRFR